MSHRLALVLIPPVLLFAAYTAWVVQPPVRDQAQVDAARMLADERTTAVDAVEADPKQNGLLEPQLRSLWEGAGPDSKLLLDFNAFCAPGDGIERPLDPKDPKVAAAGKAFQALIPRLKDGLGKPVFSRLKRRDANFREDPIFVRVREVAQDLGGAADLQLADGHGSNAIDLAQLATMWARRRRSCSACPRWSPRWPLRSRLAKLRRCSRWRRTTI